MSNHPQKSPPALRSIPPYGDPYAQHTKYDNICYFATASEHNIQLASSLSPFPFTGNVGRIFVGPRADQNVQSDQMHLFFSLKWKFFWPMYRRNQDVCCFTLFLGCMIWPLGSHEGIQSWITGLYRASVNV